MWVCRECGGRGIGRKRRDGIESWSFAIAFQVMGFQTVGKEVLSTVNWKASMKSIHKEKKKPVFAFNLDKILEGSGDIWWEERTGLSERKMSISVTGSLGGKLPQDSA